MGPRSMLRHQRHDTSSRSGLAVKPGIAPQSWAVLAAALVAGALSACSEGGVAIDTSEADAADTRSSDNAHSDIRFSVATNYPSVLVTPNGSANQGDIADMNGDGHLDIVAGGQFEGPSLLLGRGDGSFAFPVVVESLLGSNVIAVDDFNRDGIPDIVSASYTTGQFTVLLGQGDGAFLNHGQYALGGFLAGIFPSGIAVADFNQDGYPDFAFSRYMTGDIPVFLGSPDATYSPAPSIDTGGFESLAILAVDLNQDSIPDLAIADSFPQTVPDRLRPGGLAVAIANGDGTFQSPTNYQIGLMAEVVTQGDINEDGHVDIITSNSFAGEISILYGQGDGTLADEQRIEVHGQIPGYFGIDPDAEIFEGVLIEDLDRDGHLDLSYTILPGNHLYIFSGDGRGNFTPAADFQLSTWPEGILPGDFNEDGCIDMAIPGNLPPIEPLDLRSEVSILLNQSPGC